MAEHSLTTNTPTGTYSLGKRLGEKIPAGSVLGLVGELGCGKTTLTKGVCAGLGVPERIVSSPTFVLINEYRGRVPVLHMDLYRLNTLADGIDLGILDYLRQLEDAVMIIEWAEKIESMLPHNCIMIRFEYIAPKRRQLTFFTEDEHLAELVRELSEE